MRKDDKNDSPKSYWINGEPHGNFSLDKRDTFDPKDKYIGVRLQQGVPLLDRDWNELEDIRRYQDMSFRKHFLGDGSPDDAGRITVSSDGADLFIKKGRYLVDGLEVEIADDNESADTIPFRFKEVTLNWPLTNPPNSRTDQVYLEVTIVEVGYKDTNPNDSDLGNTNDVGRETCIRHKLMWTVKVEEGKEMPPSDQFFHRSLLATINRKGSVILPEEIIDKRSRLRTFISGNEGRLRVNGPLDGGLRVKEGLIVESGGQYIGPVAEGLAGLVIENGGLWIKAGGLSVDSGGVLNAYGQLNARSSVNIDGGLTVNTGGARIGGELANVKSPLYSTPLAIRASGMPQGLMCFEAKNDKEEWIRKWDLTLGTGLGPKSGLEFVETDVAHGRLFLQEGGCVGIGTMDPKQKLHVEGGEIHSGGNIETRAGFSFANRDAPNNGAYVEGGEEGQRWVWHARGQVARLWSAGDKLVVDKNGFVGIGTSDPKARLHVSWGDLQVDGIANVGWLHVREWMDVKKGVGIEGGLTVSSGGANISPGLGVNGPMGVSGALDVKGGATIIGGLTINTGNVGIGTTEPKRRLHVEGGEIHSGGTLETTAGFSFANRDAPNNGAYVEGGEEGQRWVWHARGQVARLWSAGDRLAVDKNGNVGIGTIEPKAKLHVAGDVQVDGVAGIGWLHVREYMDVKKGIAIEGGLTVSSGVTGLNGPLNLGHGVVLCSWFEDKVGDWFGIFYNGLLKTYCNLNTGEWRKDPPANIKLLQWITG